MSSIETRNRAVRRAARFRQTRVDSLKVKPRSTARASDESIGGRATAPGAPASMEVEAAVRKLTQGDAAAAVRRCILRALDRQGPLTSAEIPAGWPITREHIRALLRELAADGLVDASASGCRSYRLTALGRRCLEEIDWSEAIELELDSPSQSSDANFMSWSAPVEIPDTASRSVVAFPGGSGSSSLGAP